MEFLSAHLLRPGPLQTYNPIEAAWVQGQSRERVEGRPRSWFSAASWRDWAKCRALVKPALCTASQPWVGSFPKQRSRPWAIPRVLLTSRRKRAGAWVRDRHGSGLSQRRRWWWWW